MTKPNKFRRAVDQREADAVTPTTGYDNTTKVTVTMTRHSHANLASLLRVLALRHKCRRLPMGPVGVALYEIFQEDPQLQEEVVKRMT